MLQNYEQNEVVSDLKAQPVLGNVFQEQFYKDMNDRKILFLTLETGQNPKKITHIL